MAGALCEIQIEYLLNPIHTGYRCYILLGNEDTRKEMMYSRNELWC